MGRFSQSTRKDEFLAVGSYSPDNKKAELYNFGIGKWNTVDDYPFGTNRYMLFDMLYLPITSTYLVMGGSDSSGYLSQIVTFKNGVWSDVGQLNSPRESHSAQWLDYALVVAGGWGDQYSSEACTMNGETGKFNCVDITPTLTDYALGVSFVVSSAFCV